MVKARPPPFFSSSRTAYPESGSRKFSGTCGAKKRRANRIYIVSAIPAAAGRSSPHAGFISLPGRLRRACHHRQRHATGAGRLSLAGPGWPDGPAAERLARRAWPGVPGPRPCLPAIYGRGRRAGDRRAGRRAFGCCPDDRVGRRLRPPRRLMDSRWAIGFSVGGVSVATNDVPELQRSREKTHSCS